MKDEGTYDYDGLRIPKEFFHGMVSNLNQTSRIKANLEQFSEH